MLLQHLNWRMKGNKPVLRRSNSPKFCFDPDWKRQFLAIAGDCEIVSELGRSARHCLPPLHGPNAEVYVKLFEKVKGGRSRKRRGRTGSEHLFLRETTRRNCASAQKFAEYLSSASSLHSINRELKALWLSFT